MGHIQCAQCAIGYTRRGQKDQGAKQIQHHIADAGVGLGGLAADGQQHKARHQQHFKEDVEIEKIPGQKSAVHPQHQYQKKRVEGHALPVEIDGGDGERQHGQGDNRCQAEQNSRQPVGDEGDAKGRNPAAHLQHQSMPGKGVLGQGQGRTEIQDKRARGQPALQFNVPPPAPARDSQKQRGDKEGEGNGGCQ